ncbi:MULTISPECIES: nitroreductase family protein [unclassified Desulfovibrio]|uniref:nitroreductase family protein n=1 Tax=unclassified Desulfovibrio TaxID=2593640 RepID=UPI0013EDE28A|nr:MULTISPECIES: nitroreductase family protein [unclassified Desulfovibrio]
MDFEELLARRRSTRKYQDRPLTPRQIGSVIASASRAPVGSNLYKDVHITVVRDQKLLHRLCEAAWKRFSTKEKVKEIAGDTADGENLLKPNLFYGAPAVFFVSHRRQDVQPGIEWANVTTITCMMHLEAVNLGLGSVFMWGALESMRLFPELDHTRELELPEGFVPLIALAVGYPCEAPGPAKKQHVIAVNYIPLRRDDDKWSCGAGIFAGALPPGAACSSGASTF